MVGLLILCLFVYVTIFVLMRINKDEINPELEESIVNTELRGEYLEM